MEYITDVLVIGSGTSGLTAAVKLADLFKVSIICKTDFGTSASLYAQGGIATVISKSDSFSSHIKDTLLVGDGICDKDTVEFVVQHSKKSIDWLLKKGVKFSLEDDNISFHLTIEGGHSHRRIVHADDATGLEIQSTLMKNVKNNKNIDIYDHHSIIDIIKKDNICAGGYVLDIKRNLVKTFFSKVVILASGGSSNIYKYSTSPVSATGDGIAVAYRVGCRVANLEFNQFHPTCLYTDRNPFLLSEALRGEGAYLRLPNGYRFMRNIHKKSELAPRDILSRSIYWEIKKNKCNYVLLDITHKSSSFIIKRFPVIHRTLLKRGFDLTKDLIPIVPAAHYTCGGILVNQNSMTDLLNLYAIGEAACTGLHGANRIASNSLLECLVYAQCASKHIIEKLPFLTHVNIVPMLQSYTRDFNSVDSIFINFLRNHIRFCMSNYMGIVRNNKHLVHALSIIKRVSCYINYNCFYKNVLNSSLLELRNSIIVAELMIKSAIMRKESRGSHFNVDYKDKENNEKFLKPTIISLNV